MSWLPSEGPEVTVGNADAILTTLQGKAKDLGGFEVRRLLPALQRRMVGPFIFFDAMGPAAFAPGRGIDVRPHPHIGLATVTYLFEGEILHRDSLGSVQPIRPGDVNWMTAGRGIVHSERTGPEVRAAGGPLAGIQAWVALPHGAEECAPAFAHHAAADLPLIEGENWRMRVIAGDWEGTRSPVALAWETLYADASLVAGARLLFPAEHEERGVYAAEGAIEIDGRTQPGGTLLVLRPGRPVTVTAQGPARLILLGGAPMDGPRHIWWNFVSSSKERLEQAKEDWRQQRYAAVPGETEFIPLP